LHIYSQLQLNQNTNKFENANKQNQTHIKGKERIQKFLLWGKKKNQMTLLKQGTSLGVFLGLGCTAWCGLGAPVRSVPVVGGGGGPKILTHFRNQTKQPPVVDNTNKSKPKSKQKPKPTHLCK
jgi:hypothetical protein